VRLAVVGPLIGRNPGYITTQGEKLADMFRERGHAVVETSSRINRAARLADLVTTMVARRRDYDTVIALVYSRGGFVVADVASALARALGKRLVLSLNGGGLPDQFSRYPRWSRRVLGRAHTIVVQSNFLRRAIAEMDLDAHVIPNVLDSVDYPYRSRERVTPRLFWMRSFHDIYNPEMAIHVLAALRVRHPEARLVMAGPDKGLLDRTRRLAVELGVADAVEFPGFLDAEGKHRQGAASDIFINTNRIDNRPLAVVEAAAMGLVVVATAVGGVPDLLTHERNALLVPSEDVAAMVAAIERLIADPALAARLSSAGPALASSSAMSGVAPAWERLLAAL
jgi:glycosyltransferase involved in cell wall biosynthesis